MKTSDPMQDVQTGLQRGRSERKPEGVAFHPPSPSLPRQALYPWVLRRRLERSENEARDGVRLGVPGVVGCDRACFNILRKVARHV